MTFDLKDPTTGQIKSFASALEADNYLSGLNAWKPPTTTSTIISTPSTPSSALLSSPVLPTTTRTSNIATPTMTIKPVTTQFGQVDIHEGTPAIPTVPQETIDWGKAPTGYFYNAFGQLMREEAQVFDAAGKQINYIATPTGVYSPQINPAETNIRQIQEIQAFKPARITVSSGAPAITAKTFESQEELQRVAPYITNIKDIEALPTDRLLESQIKPTRSLPSWFESGRIPVSDLDASGKYIGKPQLIAEAIVRPTIVRPTQLQEDVPIASPRPPSGNMRFYSPSSVSMDEKNKILEQKLAGQPVAVAASLPSYYPDQRMTSVANGKVDIRLSKSDIERMSNGEELYFSILPTGGFDITTTPVAGGTNLSMRHQDIDWSKSAVVVDLNKSSVAFNTNKGNFTLLSPEMTGQEYYDKLIPVQKGKVAKEAGFYRAFLEPTGIVSEVDTANMQRQLAEDEMNRQIREFSKLKSDYTANRYAQIAAAYGQFQDVKDNRAAYEALGFKIQTDRYNNIVSITPPSEEEYNIRYAYASMGTPISPNVTATELKAWETPVRILGQTSGGASSGIMGDMSRNASAYISSRKQIYNKNAYREVLMPKSKKSPRKKMTSRGKGQSRSQGLIYPIPNLNPFKVEPKQTRKKGVKKKTPRKARTTTKTSVEERMSRNVNKFLGW